MKYILILFPLKFCGYCWLENHHIGYQDLRESESVLNGVNCNGTFQSMTRN